MRRSLARGLLLGGCFVAVAASMLPAAATPSNTKVAGVFQLPCKQSVCDASQDRVIADSGAGNGVAQVQVSSASSVGLDWVALQAQLGSGAWTCLKYWDLNSAASFSSQFNWDTTVWPGDCPSAPAATLTRNGQYSLRVVAKEAVSGDTQISASRVLKVNNRPVAPGWDAGLSVSGAEDRQPTVELRFHGGQEPDILEYHFVRLAPDGTETEYTVSAAKPGGQGCDLSGTTYVCSDDDFPTTGFGGTYSYVLIALRSSPVAGITCSLGTKPNCIGSSTSEPQSVQIDEPAPDPDTTGGGAPPPDLTPNGGPAPVRGSKHRVVHHGASGDRATYCDFFCGSVSKTLPYGQRNYYLPNGSATQGPSTTVAAAGTMQDLMDNHALWRSVAGGLLLLLAALHIVRVMRRA